MRLSKQLYQVEDGIAEIYASLIEHSRVLTEFIQEGTVKLEFLPYLAEDVFRYLYLAQPQVREANTCWQSTIITQWVCQTIAEAPDFSHLQQLSLGDAVSAGMATLYFLQDIIKYLDTEFLGLANSLYQSEHKFYRSQLELKAAERVLEVLNSLGQYTLCLAYTRKIGHLQRRCQVFTTKVQVNLEKLKNYLQRHGKKLNGNIYHANTKATEKVEKTKQQITGWQGGSGQWRKLTGTFGLLDNLVQSHKLVRILECLEKLKQAAGGQKDASFMEARPDLALGSQIDRVVPEEIVNLLRLPKLFYQRVVDENLLLYQAQQSQPAGPLIICLDCSGSMQGPKEIISKAFVLGLLELAQQKTRDVVVILFGGRQDDMKLVLVPEGRCQLEQLLEISDSFLQSPSTDFAKPLQKAIDFLTESSYAGGDIILITDGFATISPDFLNSFHQVKQDRGFSTTTVLINQGPTEASEVASFSDEVLISSDYLGCDIAEPLLIKFV